MNKSGRRFNAIEALLYGCFLLMFLLAPVAWGQQLIITADNITVAYGDTIPIYTVSYKGFENDDDEKMLEGELEFACEYTDSTDIGTYEIVPSGLTSAKYKITFAPGTISVLRTEGTFKYVKAIDFIYSAATATLAEVKLPEGYSWTDTSKILKPGKDYQPFDAMYIYGNYQATGKIMVNVSKEEEHYVVTLTDAKKDEELGAENKIFFIADTDCKTNNANFQITAPFGVELKINGNASAGEQDINGNLRHNANVALGNNGLDTIYYNVGTKSDTAIIVSPIPYEKLVKQKWGLLIINNNPQNNGGHVFSEFEWIKNGVKQPNKFQYYRYETINPEDIFKIQALNEDGIKISSCSGSPIKIGQPSELSGAKKQALGLNGQKPAPGAKIYNMKGKLIANEKIPAGIYIVKEE